MVRHAILIVDMKFSKILSSIVLFSTMFTMGAGCFGGETSTVSTGKVTLEVWGVFDEADAWKSIIAAYKAAHPNVTINYTKLRYEEYRDKLIRSIAEGKGPDIMAIQNTWLGGFANLLAPMPDAIKVAQLETQGTLRKETVLVSTSESTMSMKILKKNFLPTVVADVVMPYKETEESDPVDKIYALPMGVDTLGLFYNQDLFSAAGIPQPPATWTDFQQAVKTLTKLDPAGAIIQSGVGLGTGNNVERSSDILSVLMMQNGVHMIDERGRPIFNDIPKGTASGVNPSVDAIRFYTDFANPTKEVYTWNKDQPSSLEAFVNGKAAMFIGYSYHLPIIYTLAPKLNVGIAPLPQISTVGDVRQVNYASYWAEGVSRNSKFQDYAWSFILFATSQDNVQSYLTKAGKPTALRSLIANQLNDESLGVFAQQLLTAQTWYRGKDIDAAEKGMNQLITDVLLGTAYKEPEDAVDNAIRVVQQTYL